MRAVSLSSLAELLRVHPRNLGCDPSVDRFEPAGARNASVGDVRHLGLTEQGFQHSSLPHGEGGVQRRGRVRTEFVAEQLLHGEVAIGPLDGIPDRHRSAATHPGQLDESPRRIRIQHDAELAGRHIELADTQWQILPVPLSANSMSPP
jgi:hypothetical protein